MKGSGPRGSGGYSHRKKRCAANSQDASDLSPEVLFLPGCDCLVKSVVIFSAVSIPENVSLCLKKNNNEESTKLSLVEMHFEMFPRRKIVRHRY